MNIYLISQDENDGYDTYDSAVVAAPDEATARTIVPDENWPHWGVGTWCSSPDKVKVEYIGTTERPQGVILASFNAG